MAYYRSAGSVPRTGSIPSTCSTTVVGLELSASVRTTRPVIRPLHIHPAYWW